MNKTSAFRILIPAALALTSSGFAQASVNEVPRMSDDVYRTSGSFCSTPSTKPLSVSMNPPFLAPARQVLAPARNLLPNIPVPF